MCLFSKENFKQTFTLRSTWVHTHFFGGVRVANLFSFLCCSIMCLYVLSYVLSVSLDCPLLITTSVFSNVYLYYFTYWILFQWLNMKLYSTLHEMFHDCTVTTGKIFSQTKIQNTENVNYSSTDVHVRIQRSLYR